MKGDEDSRDKVGNLLDCPRFLKALQLFKESFHKLSSGNYISKELGRQLAYEEERYLKAQEEFCRIKLVTNCWRQNERVAVRRQFIETEVAIDFPQLYEGERQLREECLPVDYNLLLSQQEAALVASAKLFFINESESIHSVRDILNLLDEYERRADKDGQVTVDLLLEAACTTSRASLILGDLVNSMESIHNDTRPIATEYVGNLSEYLKLVIESLAMKIAIVEREAKVSFYGQNQDWISRIGLAQEPAKHTNKELIKSLEMAEAQLLLYQQLGPSFARIASHHTQIINQLAMVEEDLRHLHRI